MMSAARREETWALPLKLADGEMDQLNLEGKKTQNLADVIYTCLPPKWSMERRGGLAA